VHALAFVTARSSDLAPAAPSPRSAAAAATSAATAGAASTHYCAASAGPAATATSATANNNDGQLHVVVANVFLIEQMERGETDVGHFLFAKNEALIGRVIVGLRDMSGGQRGRGCAAHQRKTQSGGTESRQEGRFGCAFPFRSFFDPWHGRILSCEHAWRGKGCAVTCRKPLR
jgi:hypothetical protein